MNWQKIGVDVVRLLLPVALSLLLGALAFRKFVAPELTTALEAATKVATQLASLGGIKKAQWDGSQELVKSVTTDLVRNKYPEFDLIKMAVSPSTWTQIEDALENNPAGVIELIDKYGHYFGMAEAGAEQPSQTDF